METEFVPYKLSEKLQNIGFNEPCFAMWQKKKTLWFAKKKEWLYNFELEPDEDMLIFHTQCYPNNVLRINDKIFLKESVNFTAPLWQQAFDWLLKKLPFGYGVVLMNRKCELWHFDHAILHRDSTKEQCLEKLIEIYEKSLEINNSTN